MDSTLTKSEDFRHLQSTVFMERYKWLRQNAILEWLSEQNREVEQHQLSIAGMAEPDWGYNEEVNASNVVERYRKLQNHRAKRGESCMPADKMEQLILQGEAEQEFLKQYPWSYFEEARMIDANFNKLIVFEQNLNLTADERENLEVFFGEFVANNASIDGPYRIDFFKCLALMRIPPDEIDKFDAAVSQNVQNTGCLIPLMFLVTTSFCFAVLALFC